MPIRRRLTRTRPIGRIKPGTTTVDERPRLIRPGRPVRPSTTTMSEYPVRRRGR